MKRLLTFLDGIGSVGALVRRDRCPVLLPAFRRSHCCCRARRACKVRRLRALCLAGLCAALLVWLGARRSSTPQPLAVRAWRNQRRRFMKLGASATGRATQRRSGLVRVPRFPLPQLTPIISRANETPCERLPSLCSRRLCRVQR
jgi:hypothetical protein